MRPDDLIHFCAPARLVIAEGARHQLPALLHRMGWRCGVLVTDSYFHRQTDVVQDWLRACEALDIDWVVCDAGLPDPTTTLCDEATRAVRAELRGRRPDHVVALGGGSNIDLAKALCLTLPEGRPIADFKGDIRAVPGAPMPLPLVAVPTTAGTGSEATPGAILLDPANATKVAVMDNALRPQIALIDPELTWTCPPRVTADAGIDAFTHAIESLLTIDSAAYDREGHVDPGYSGRSALTMLFAGESLRLCWRYLDRVYRDGSDREARSGMAYASIYAALSYGSAGLNAGHGIAYAVAGLTHRSHGSTNAVVLPYVLDALCDVREAELAQVAGWMGLDTPDPAAAARAVPVAVRDLIGRLGIPTDLADFGVPASALPALIADALAVTRLAKAFPVPDVAERYARIVQNAHAGILGGETETG